MSSSSESNHPSTSHPITQAPMELEQRPEPAAKRIKIESESESEVEEMKGVDALATDMMEILKLELACSYDDMLEGYEEEYGVKVDVKEMKILTKSEKTLHFVLAEKSADGVYCNFRPIGASKKIKNKQ